MTARPAGKGGIGGKLRSAAADLLFALPIYRHTLRGGASGPYAVLPESLVAGEAEAADRMFQGRWRLAGEELNDARQAPFDLPPPTRTFALELHRFGWLRHFTAAGGEAARRHARALVQHWLRRYGDFDRALWAPDILAPRLVHWLANASFLMQGADDAFRAEFSSAIARQLRHLRRAHPRHGEPEADFACGLAFGLGGLALPRFEREVARGLALIETALARLLLADGSHLSRRPDLLLHLLADLITLTRALDQGGRPASAMLKAAIERAAPALRFFRHGDGTLGLFNGAKACDSGLVDQVLAKSESRARAEKSLADAGFERAHAGRSVLMFDVGRPIDRNLPCHAGLLAFELSIGRRRVIVNCGASERDEGDWSRAMRASAAHSTLVLADQGSLVLDGQGRPSGELPEVTRARAETDEHVMLEGAHGGYSGRFGLVHRRRLWLTRNGEELYGEDALLGNAREPAPFAIRFHLHPEIQASMLQDGASALLRLSSTLGLRFRVAGAVLSLEESVYFGDPGRIARSRQLVLSGEAGEGGANVTWHLGRMQ